MNWQHFLAVWTAAFGTAAFFSFCAVAFAADKYRTGCEDAFDKRLWLIPGVLTFFTAMFGSVAALLAK